MTIPLATTHVTVTRSLLDGDTDQYDPDEYPDPDTAVIATGVRAVISPPTASTNLVAGQRVSFGAKLICDPTDLQASDTVTEDNGTVWTVLWARPIKAVGLDHTEAGLRMVTGFGA